MRGQGSLSIDDPRVLWASKWCPKSGGRRRGRPPKTSVSATLLANTISIDGKMEESTPAPPSRRGGHSGLGGYQPRPRIE